MLSNMCVSKRLISLPRPPTEAHYCTPSHPPTPPHRALLALCSATHSTSPQASVTLLSTRSPWADTPAA